MISKYHKQNKPESALDSIKRSEPIKRPEIDVKDDTINHYEPEKTNVAFNDKCIEYKNKGDENPSIKQYLEKIRLHLGNIIDVLRRTSE